MTVAELRRQLDQCGDDQKVIFTPGDYCGEGYPEWESADVTLERGCGVTILLKDERP